MLCKKCSKEILDGSLFCNFCGKKQVTKGELKLRSPKSRGNGQGTAYKLSNGSWACEITKYVGGVRKRCRKKGFPTKCKAVEYISQLSINKKKKKTMTIFEAYKAIEPVIAKLSVKRQKVYESAYKKVKDFESCDINELEISDLQGIIDDIEGGFYAKRYVKDLLNKLFEYAFADGKIDRNIVPYITLPRNEIADEKVIFTQDEVNTLWRFWSAGDEMAGYLLICLYCCIRTGELWSIRCSSIDYEKHIMFGGIKTNKGKFAPIFIVNLIEPVIRYFADKGEEHIYNGSIPSFYRDWQRFKKEAGLREELQPYCGRHSCTTVLTHAGLPEAVIMQITRHTKYDTTLMYTHIDTDSVLEKMNKAVEAIKL